MIKSNTMRMTFIVPVSSVLVMLLVSASREIPPLNGKVSDLFSELPHSFRYVAHSFRDSEKLSGGGVLKSGGPEVPV